jgi:uncharacterized protein (TIGR03435 family)
MFCASISLLLLINAGQAAPVQASPTPSAAKPTAYDTVSIRQNKSGSMSYGWRPTPNGISATNITVRNFLLQAYGPINSRLISGLPNWTTTLHFDIEGKLDDDTFAQLSNLSPKEAFEANQRRMQQILVDRFNLKLHHEQKELPAYALVVAKGGSKLKEADPNLMTKPSAAYRPGAVSGRDGEFSGQAITTDRLARGLSSNLDREVVDQTGLIGNYDIALKWQPIRASQDSATADADSSRASIFTAVQEQLGLKLESTKAMTDTIVVDSIEMPSEN